MNIYSIIFFFTETILKGITLKPFKFAFLKAMGRAFKEQIIWLSRAWDGWSEAEQVVALYSVARKLSPVPTRFLQILLTYNFPVDCSDILVTEARANDPCE